MAPTELKDLNAQLKDLLDMVFIKLVFCHGVIQYTFLKNKDGSLRMCINYHQLKNVIINNKYPLPQLIIYLINSMVRVTFPKKIDIEIPPT